MKTSRMTAAILSAGMLAGAGQVLAAGGIDYYYDEDMAGPSVEVPSSSTGSSNLAHIQYFYDEDLALHAERPAAGSSSQVRTEVVNYYYDEDIVDMAAMEEILD